MDEEYRFIRTLNVDDNLIGKTHIHIIKSNVIMERFKMTSFTICLFI